MKQDNLFIGYDAMKGLMGGVFKAADVVGGTLGTAGSNSLIQCLERPGHYSTNDGATILGSMRFADPLEEMGRKVLDEAVSRANRASGDGSSTTCVLTASILAEGMKYIDKENPMVLKKSLESCIALIEASVRAQKKEITINDVASVASISAEDEGIGQMIQEIYQKIGKDGVIQWDISKTTDDSYAVGTGITISDCGYVSAYFCDPGQKEIRIANPSIILLRRKLTALAEFEKIFPELFNAGQRNVIIFCDEFDMQPVADAINTREKAGFRPVVVKMPTLWGDEWWEDLAVATGAKIISPASGIRLLQATSAICGTVENITIGKEEVIIEGIADMKKHILGLQVENTDASLQRAQRLNTKTARYFVGAHSESALAYRRLKVEDAIHASSMALDDGIVPGGGVALIQASRDLPDGTIGAKILKESLITPTLRIIANASKNRNFNVQIDGWGKGEGFDSSTGSIVDMIQAKIIDPCEVVLNSVRNSIGVAAGILTLGNVITIPIYDDLQKM